MWETVIYVWKELKKITPSFSAAGSNMYAGKVVHANKNTRVSLQSKTVLIKDIKENPEYSK